MVDLSATTRSHVLALFEPEEAPEAERLLRQECAENLPLLGVAATPEGLERVRFAALRLSGGRLQRLRDAVEMAKVDWRDVLVGAGFGHRVEGHLHWKPRRLGKDELQLWFAGTLPDRVKLAFNDPVEILWGKHRGARGTVAALAGLEPESYYRIDIGGGVASSEEYQSSLRPVPEPGSQNPEGMG